MQVFRQTLIHITPIQNNLKCNIIRHIVRNITNIVVKKDNHLAAHLKQYCFNVIFQDVRDHTLEDRMESFFLSETTKYLYLLFDTENFIHNSGAQATIIETPRGQCVIDAGNFHHHLSSL